MYAFCQELHFSAEFEQAQANINLSIALTNEVQKKSVVPVTASIALVTEFLKGSFDRGAMFSVPTDVFQIACRPESELVVPVPCSGLDLVPLLKQVFAEDFYEHPLGSFTFFQVVGPRPENKFKLRTSNKTKTMCILEN